MAAHTPHTEPHDRAKKFETIFPAAIFWRMEEWRKAKGMTRSKALVGAMTRLMDKQQVPLQNRMVVGMLCPKCGATWPFQDSSRLLNHNVGGAQNPPTCPGRPVVVVE